MSSKALTSGPRSRPIRFQLWRSWLELLISPGPSPSLARRRRRRSLFGRSSPARGSDASVSPNLETVSVVDCFFFHTSSTKFYPSCRWVCLFGPLELTKDAWHDKQLPVLQLQAEIRKEKEKKKGLGSSESRIICLWLRRQVMYFLTTTPFTLNQVLINL